MANTHQRRSYNLGTIVMDRDGIAKVKTREGWIAEHRHAMQIKLNRELEPGEKVFHLDNTLRGENGFNEMHNLTIIKCRITKWVKFKHSRVVYEPRQEKVFKTLQRT